MQTDFRNEWLSQLGQRLTLPALAFDETNLCQLSLDDELMITVYKPTDSAYLVLFGQLPVTEVCSVLMQKMLTENRNHSKHTAPVLSLSDDLDAIEVHYTLTETELTTGEDRMDQLIDTLEYWRSYLTD